MLQKPSWHCRHSLKELKTLGMDSGSTAAALGMELGSREWRGWRDMEEAVIAFIMFPK